MRVPSSVIMMSVLCAVPFVLAIRGTAHDAKEGDAVEDDLDRQVLEEQRFEQARAAAQQARDEAAKAAKAKTVRITAQLVGDEPASLGELFAGVQPGARAGDPQLESVRSALAEIGDVVIVDWDVNGLRLEGVTITLTEHDCDPLVKALAKWGDGVDNRWANPRTHLRAELNSAGCSLTYERYVDVDGWLDRKDTAIVPMNAIGQSAKKLHDRVLPLIVPESDADEAFSWSDLGLAGTADKTIVTAIALHDKILSITAEFTAGANIDAIEARITKLAGVKPVVAPEVDEAGATVKTWKARVPIELRTDPTNRLTIGTSPAQR